MNNARDYALLRLDQKTLPGWAPRRLHPKFASAIAEPTDSRDRALAEQIETGIVKNLLQLQHLTQQFADRPLAKIHPVLQKILAIAIYQLRFLDRVRPAAAVDEAVEQTKRFGLGHARGFVNAVLRKAAATAKDPLPPSEDPVEQARLQYSHPQELFDRLQALLDTERALEICRHNNAEPPTIARLAPGKTAADLEAAGFFFLPHTQPGMVVLVGADKATISRLVDLQLAQIQDATSASVIAAADIRSGMTVLDRCAGMGTKTIQALELTGTSADIVAIDPARARCEALLRTLVARQATNVRVIQSDRFPRGNPDVPQQFQRVLVDVPCSNSGVLARRPEARYFQTDSALKDLVELQRAILADSVSCVASGGLLIYSTCSLWSEENQQVIQWLLNEFPRLEILRDQTTLPQSGPDPTTYRDGGYYAILQRPA